MNPMTRQSRIASIFNRLVLLATAFLASVAVAQVEEFAPVALDDSPAAQLALDEARAQAADNPERAAELAAELLDEYSTRVVAREGSSDLFESVRSSVIRLLESDAGVLSSWMRKESSKAVSMLDRDGALVTFEHRPLTPAGLEAGLRIAQRSIESRRPVAGLRLIDTISRWPGADELGPRTSLLRAVALIDLARAPDSDPSLARERDRAIEIVTEESPSRGEALIRLRDDLVVGSDVPGPMDFKSIEAVDWTPLWTVDIGDSLFLRKTTNMSTGRVSSPTSQQRSFDAGSYLVSVPAIFDDLLLVNEGFLIEAMDRYTGRLVWYRDHGLARGIMLSGIPTDLNEIVLADGEAYTVLGHFFSGGRGGDGTVLRFDPRTGVDRWRIRPERMDDDPLLEGAEPSGTPLVVGDLLAIPLRKTTPRLETIDMVLAVDREDGSFRWLRTIASSGKMRTNAGRPLTRLAVLDGDVLVASAAGAIARLSGDTGGIRWLRLDEVPLRVAANSGFAWQIPAPVVCDRGVAVVDAARRHWMILDPESGEQLVKMPIGGGSVAGAANWLMLLPARGSDPELVLAIGSSDVIAIDPRFPDRRVWSLAERFRETGLSFGSQLASGVRGRVFPVDGGIVVPVVDRLYLVDGSTGDPVPLVDMQGPSNPVVTRDGIYAAGSRSILASMPIERAIAALEARLRSSPDAIPQALALMELSERIGRRDLLVFAAQSAVEASIRRNEPGWYREVLDRILELLGRTGEADGAILLELAESVARNPMGQARLELVRGDWLAGIGRGPEAVDAWMAILADEEVAAGRVPFDVDLEGSASVAALSRIRSRIEDDPTLKQELDRRGSAQVRAALADRAPVPELIKLARKYAGTDAAILAGIRSVEILRDEGRPQLAAFVAMVIARDFDPEQPGRLELLAAAIDSARDSDRVDLVGPLARMSLVAGSTSEEEASTERRPVLDANPDRIEILKGIPAPIAGEVSSEAPTDGLAMIEGSSLVWRASKGLDSLWTIPLASPEARIVGFVPNLLVWEGGDQKEPRLSAIDVVDGARLWSTPEISALLPPRGRLDVNTDGFLPDGRPFIPHQVMPIKVEGGILLIRRDGALSFVDGSDGRSVRWSVDGVMDRIYDARIAGGMLHLGGSEINDRGELVGVTVSLDPQKGRRLHRSVHETGEVRMVIGDDAGRLAVITKGAVSMEDPAGRAIGCGGGWTCRDPILAYAPFAWLVEDDLVLVDEQGIARTLEADFGVERTKAWGAPPDGDLEPGRLLEIVRFGDRWLFRHASRLFLYDRFGKMVGADGIARRDLENVAVEPVADGILLVSRSAQRRLHRVHRLDERRGLFASGTPFDYASPSRFDEVIAIDGWLLLQMSGETHALPMSGGRNDPPGP